MPGPNVAATTSRKAPAVADESGTATAETVSALTQTHHHAEVVKNDPGAEPVSHSLVLLTIGLIALLAVCSSILRSVRWPSQH